MNQKIILFVFAGREANMELQWPYVERLLETYPEMEYHVWDLTRNVPDHEYIQGLANRHERVSVFSSLWPGRNVNIQCRKRYRKPRWCDCVECRPAPFEEVYQWYADQWTRQTETNLAGNVVIDEKWSPYDNTIFVKLDDDIVFIETDRFGDILDAVRSKPHSVISANVVNNVVCAKHDPDLRPVISRAFAPQTDKAWFDLHADDQFARLSHDWFLRRFDEHLDQLRDHTLERALPGEKPSINFIAMTYDTLCRVSDVVTAQHSKLGDEGAINHNFLPWITVGFRVAHLYFGPQRVRMDNCIDSYRNQYAKLAKEYLG